MSLTNPAVSHREGPCLQLPYNEMKGNFIQSPAADLFKVPRGRAEWAAAGSACSSQGQAAGEAAQCCLFGEWGAHTFFSSWTEQAGKLCCWQHRSASALGRRCAMGLLLGRGWGAQQVTGLHHPSHHQLYSGSGNLLPSPEPSLHPQALGSPAHPSSAPA